MSQKQDIQATEGHISDSVVGPDWLNWSSRVVEGADCQRTFRPVGVWGARARIFPGNFLESTFGKRLDLSDRLSRKSHLSQVAVNAIAAPTPRLQRVAEISDDSCEMS